MWYYVSFATDTEFLGACIVEGDDVKEAYEQTLNWKINPGGEVLILEITEEEIIYPKYKLLTREEIGPDGVSYKDWSNSLKEAYNDS